MDQTHPSILIIDDNPRLTESYRAFFEQAGFSIDIADDGELGLAAAQKAPHDLILLDLMLPKMDGLEVLEALKADAACKDTPVIVLTALLNGAEKDAAQKLGAVAYVEKVETDPEDLLKIVKRALKAHHETATDTSR